MRIVQAVVVDSRHLELAEDLDTKPGQHLRIVVANDDDDDAVWQRAAADAFLTQYAPEDAVYDRL